MGEHPRLSRETEVGLGRAQPVKEKGLRIPATSSNTGAGLL
jgi:hypothetical protein